MSDGREDGGLRRSCHAEKRKRPSITAQPGDVKSMHLATKIEYIAVSRISSQKFHSQKFYGQCLWEVILAFTPTSLP